jgi:hypothetical protein
MNINTDPNTWSNSNKPGTLTTWSMKNITRKSSTIMVTSAKAITDPEPGKVGASMTNIRIAATPAGGTMIGMATGEMASWRAEGLEDSELDGSALGNVIFSAEMSSTNPPAIRTASREILYFAAKHSPIKPTIPTSADAIRNALVATSRLKGRSAWRINL